jgi:hypothetical protein
MRVFDAAFRFGCTATLIAGLAHGATRTVGPGKTYPKPCAAVAAASDGDTIEIDAGGNYAGDVCQIAKNGLTLRGVGGRAKIDAAGQNSGGKAIWVVSGNDTTVEDVEFSSASVPDMNGAGIRQEGTNLTVRRCYFHDNQDGILAGDDPKSEILIENSEFDHNGAGDGYSHNLYINHVGKLVFRYNYSHRAVVGHLLKSRAAETYVLENRLTGETDGSESYEIDVPNGGKTFIVGNLVEQGKNTQNPTMLAYQEEGPNAANPSDVLVVASNTFVDDRGGGTFVSIGANVKTPALLVDDVFFGGGTVSTQGSAMVKASYTGSAPGFVDATHYDYHLVPGSPCVGAGVDPGSVAGFALLPAVEYVHPAGSAPRHTVGVVDIGAYELGGEGDAGSSGGTAGAGGTNAGGTNAGGTNAGGTNAGGTNAGGTNAGGTNAGGTNAGGTRVAGSSGSSGRGAVDGGTPSNPRESGGCGCHTIYRAGVGGAQDVGLCAVGMLVVLSRLARYRRRALRARAGSLVVTPPGL